MLLSRVNGELFSPVMRLGLRTFQDEIEKLFDSDSEGHSYPPLAVYNSDTETVIECEIPGIDPSKVEITIEGTLISIAGERVPAGGDKTRWISRERKYGEFRRIVELPFAIEPATVTAECSLGILTIEAKRRAEEQPRKIDVKVA